MTRIVLFAALIGATATLPLEAQGRGQGQATVQTRKAEQPPVAVQTRKGGEASTTADTRKPGTAYPQGQARGPVAVPPGHWPSAGMCRIWIDGVAPGQQPAQTDCATARRRVPSNGRVLEGDSRPSNRGSSRGDDDRDGDRDDDDRYGRNDDDDDDDRSTTRRYIDRNGLECEEKSVIKDGRRAYDVKCREPKNKDKSKDKDKGARGEAWPRTDNDSRYCVDADRDGRCDSGIGRGYPTSMPEMLGALVYGQGQRTDDVSRWLGTGRYQVRYTDQNRDRRPERVRWLDGSGTLLQEWVDNNSDGRADIVNVYTAGRLMQSIGGR